MNAPVLHNRPCPMSLAVLVANLGAQKHDADSRVACTRARSLVGTTGVCANLGPAKSRQPMPRTPGPRQRPQAPVVPAISPGHSYHFDRSVVENQVELLTEGAESNHL